MKSKEIRELTDAELNKKLEEGRAEIGRASCRERVSSPV